MAPAPLLHRPQSPLGDCSATERVSPWCHPCVPSPQEPCSPCQVHRKDWEGQCHLGGGMLPPACSCPDTLLALCSGHGAGRIPPPKIPSTTGRKQGHLCLFFSWLVGREGASALPSLIQQHKNPSAAAALCPPSPSASSQRDKEQPLCVPSPVKLSLLSWAVCEGMSLSLCCLVPKCQQGFQVLSTHQDAQATPIPSVGRWGH